MLIAEDFICLDMDPFPCGLGIFNLTAGILHCEATFPEDNPVGVFYVTESRDLTIDWVDLKMPYLTIE